MKRTPELGELARSLYVREQLTFREISTRIGINERTVRSWRDKDGRTWDTERVAYLDSKKNFHEELYDFARELMSSIRGDFQAGKTVDAARLHCFGRILPLITKPKDYDEVVAARAKAEATAEQADLATIIAQAMGIGDEPSR